MSEPGRTVADEMILDAIRRDKVIGAAQDYSSAFWHRRLLDRGEQLETALSETAALRSRVAQMEQAVEQALWHLGGDADRRAILDKGHGWQTDIFEAAITLRAVLATPSITTAEGETK